jgi:serine/threonine protein phosphatase 1
LDVTCSARFRPSKGKPKLPEGVRIYAMTDIHGCAHLLKQMLRVIDADLARSRPRYAIEVYMGDYVDRGPDSRATLDILISRSRRGNTVFLKGNHEVFLGNVLRDRSLLTEWLHVGGLYTLMSCGLTPSPTPGDEERRALVRELARAMPRRHLEFFSQLRLTFTCGDFFFVHAGVRPGVPVGRTAGG